MPGKHTEGAFEAAIEQGLLSRGWAAGKPSAFDAERAVTASDFLAFLKDSQGTLWESLRKQHGGALDGAVIDHLTKALDSLGSLEVLRRGFKFYGKRIDCAYFRPSHGLNPDVLTQYAKNRLVVTRQVHFAPSGHADANQSIDMMLSLNGIPVATVELKNPMTGQDVQDAIAQYKRRDARHKLFQFKKRALVHFAVDPDLAYMTTRLAGDGTTFLPFNRGVGGGAGNGEHPSGHRTGYLWEEVWARDSFLDLVGRFVHLVKEEKTRRDDKGQPIKVEEEKVVFPRYHQLEVVRKLVDAAKTGGPGKSYLVQHSAGSGKSNSIAWLAHHLASLHAADDTKVFDSVVVITDRTVLDQQLQNNIYQFDHKQGVVARIDEHSDQLAEALTKGTQIIITTLQKFPFVQEKVGQLAGRRYAVIVDEAHSSQTGESAKKLKEVLAARTLEAAALEDAVGADELGEDDWEDEVARSAASRGKQSNLSFFAFTATPKHKTLAIFGHTGADGKPAPFHLYSMRQAIEEGFILDVLKSYTTYKSYYRLVKAVEDDPSVPKKEAAKQLARFMSLHPHNLAQKTEVMVEHFRQKVRHKLGGRAKAMVVTASRLHAVRYKQAFDKYLKENGYGDVGVLVAFSGTVKDPDTEAEFTEPGMNVDKKGKHVSEKALRDVFDGDDFNVLVVANKYQTGFDQPLLHTMYVDKRLANVQAVQTLSRLNRTYPGKDSTFVLDFVNDEEEIRRSFQPYFESTTIGDTADPQRLYQLETELKAAQVFWISEVEKFCEIFYAPQAKASVKDHAAMNRQIDPGIDRFKALDEDAREAFRNALGAYVRLYAFLSQVVPWSDRELEKLFAFARFFETKLPQDTKRAPLRLDGEVSLKYYRLDKISEGSILLARDAPMPLKGPTETGTKQYVDEQAKLSEIIEVLNARFGADFDESDAPLFEQFVVSAVKDAEIVQQAKANPFENFVLPLKKKLEGLMVDRMDDNEKIVTRYLNEADFQAVVFEWIAKRVYEDIRKTAA
ncbi:MAG: DEAD/DEAH box helicase family protein [Sandaracinus sp.]